MQKSKQKYHISMEKYNIKKGLIVYTCIVLVFGGCIQAIYWLKFLLGVLFWAAGIGIFDMEKNAEEKREKILLYFSCFSVLAFGIWYALYLILADFIELF